MAFDVAKGVGIIAVVGLHLSNRSAGLFHDPLSAGWWTLKWINLFLNFCVPLFLLVSAILLARSASRQERTDWKRFAWRRVRSVLGPLIVWSILYWAMRYFVRHDAKIAVPGYWTDAKGRLVDLAFGKAEFHLYFMSILAQLCLVLPFFVIFFKRVRLNIWVVLLIAILMQAGSFALQKVVLFPYPGSTVFWYLSTVIPGIWVGMNWREWPSIRRVTWPVWALFAVGGFAVFGYDSWLVLTKQQPNGTIMNAAASSYTLGMPFLILATITCISGAALWSRLEGWVIRLGAMSLQIYLMHPVLMELLTTSWRLPLVRALPLPSVWLFLITLFGTYGIALLLNRIPFVDQILFGKELPAKPKPTMGEDGVA